MDTASAQKTVTQSSRANDPNTEYNSLVLPENAQASKEVRIVVDNTGEDKVDLALRALDEIARGDIQDVDADRLTQIIKDAASVIGATRELRTLRRAERVTLQTPYPGRRAGVDPIEFLTENYGDQISAGTFGPGQLGLLDKRLYQAIRDRLPRMKGSPSMRELFDSLSAPDHAGLSPTQRRAQACAAMLGTDEHQAATFFSGLRPDRLRHTEERVNGRA